MNGAQGLMVGLGALLVIGVGAALMVGGGETPANGGLTTGTPTPETAAPQPGTAPDPLKPLTQEGSGAVVSTARAKHFDPDAPPPPPPTTVLDYVCGRQASLADKITAEHMGTTYYFCCEACRTKFVEDPETVLMRAQHGD
ncbi:MAG: YHS domain-containing protein [Planctomycetota bacterium]|jgi:YHS domain-containing protein